MKIEISNNVSRVKGLRLIGSRILRLLPKGCSKIAKNGVIQVTFVDDNEIQRINKLYRGFDKPTDVVSLSYIEKGVGLRDGVLMGAGDGGNVENGDPFIVGFPGDDLLGEIFISVDTAKRQAGEFGVTFSEEVRFLLAHGILHVFGFDHETDEDREAMFKVQNEAIKGLASGNGHV